MNLVFYKCKLKHYCTFQDFANRFNGKIKPIGKARGNVVTNSLGYSNKISNNKA